MRRPLHVFRGPIGGAHLSEINGRLPESEEAGREVNSARARPI